MFSPLIVLGVFFGAMVYTVGFPLDERASCPSVKPGTYVITNSASGHQVRLDKNLINQGLWLEDEPANPPDSGMWIVEKTTNPKGYFFRNVLLDANVTSTPRLSGGMRDTLATPFDIDCAGTGEYTIKTSDDKLWTAKNSSSSKIPGYTDIILAPAQGHSSTQHFKFKSV